LAAGIARKGLNTILGKLIVNLLPLKSSLVMGFRLLKCIQPTPAPISTALCTHADVPTSVILTSTG